MLPPSGRPPLPPPRLHLTRDFPYSYSLLRKRLVGQHRALDALGPYQPTTDEYVLGQLAREDRSSITASRTLWRRNRAQNLLVPACFGS